MPDLGHVLKHLPRHVLKHLPRHVLRHVYVPGHVLKHVSSTCLTGMCLTGTCESTYLPDMCFSMGRA